MSYYNAIIERLRTLEISFEEISHEPTTSCEHSQQLRENAGWKCVGSKNIIFHAKGKFYLVTTLGVKDIKARKFKKPFGTKDIRFATQEEITNIQLGTIGSIAPFGFANAEIPIFVDSEIYDFEYFAFNPAHPQKSIKIHTQDLKKIYDSLQNPVQYFRITDEEITFSDSPIIL